MRYRSTEPRKVAVVWARLTGPKGGTGFSLCSLTDATHYGQLASLVVLYQGALEACPRRKARRMTAELAHVPDPMWGRFINLFRCARPHRRKTESAASPDGFCGTYVALSGVLRTMYYCIFVSSRAGGEFLSGDLDLVESRDARAVDSEDRREFLNEAVCADYPELSADRRVEPSEKRQHWLRLAAMWGRLLTCRGLFTRTCPLRFLIQQGLRAA